MCKLAFTAGTVILVLESEPPHRYLKLLLERHFLIHPYLFDIFLYRAKCKFLFLFFPKNLYYFCQSLNGIFCVVGVFICYPGCLPNVPAGPIRHLVRFQGQKNCTVLVYVLHRLNFGSVTKASG